MLPVCDVVLLFAFFPFAMPRPALLLLRLAALAALHWLGSRAEQQQPSVAICVAIKDQAVDVREWVYYHRAIGAWGRRAA